jgi:hypothetical protein
MGILSPSLIEKAGLDSTDLILQIYSGRNIRFGSGCLRSFSFGKEAVSRRLDKSLADQMNPTREKPGSV